MHLPDFDSESTTFVLLDPPQLLLLPLLPLLLPLPLPLPLPLLPIFQLDAVRADSALSGRLPRFALTLL